MVDRFLFFQSVLVPCEQCSTVRRSVKSDGDDLEVPANGRSSSGYHGVKGSRLKVLAIQIGMEIFRISIY